MLYLSRPTSKNKQDEGKLKLVYLPPCLLDILVQGDYLIHHDREQDEVNYVSLDSTPLGFLLKPDISFFQNATVIHAESRHNVSSITLAPQDNPDVGTVTFVFEENPMILRQWTVTQPNGIRITVTLHDVRVNCPIPIAAFQLENQ